MILPIIGGVFALLLVLYSLSRSLRRQSGVTFLSFLLGLLTIAPLSIFILRSESAGLPIRVVAVAGMLLVAGLVVAFIERRRAKPGLNKSQGVMAVGVSGLLLASIFIDPAIVDTLAKSAKASSGAPSVVSSDSSATATPVLSTPTEAETSVARNSAPLMTNTLAPTITAVPTRYLPDPLPTRFIYTTLEPTATSAEVKLCEAVVQHNLNFRSDSSAQADLLATIPFSSVIPVYGRNSDSTWLYIGYDNQFGWVSAEYVIPKAGCQNLPVHQ
ncbi:MAG: SH3 domain-containing protein [Chloroflexota bacterium]